MKVLILSCNTGGGHNSVAAAVKENYERKGCTADVVDALSFIPGGISRLTSGVHTYVYLKAPNFFNRSYFYAESHRNQFSKGHTFRRVLSFGSQSLGEYVRGNSYEQVICCHTFAGIMLTDAIRKCGLDIVSGVIETDYTIDPGAEQCALDWHFIPVASVENELEKRNVPGKRIVVSGIPVREQFFHSVPMSEAKKKIGVSESRDNILIACGSIGCGPIEELISQKNEKKLGRDEFDVTVICGNNKKLYKKLSSLYHGADDIHIFGRVDNMSLMLDGADVYITKPGGISITEAACKAKPMVLINAVGGCEGHNMDYFVNSGAALTAETTEGLFLSAVHLCENAGVRKNMEDALRKVFSENDADLIYRTMSENGKKQNAIS